MVPPTVERRVGPDRASVQLWVEKSKLLKEVDQAQCPRQTEWAKQVCRQRVFDNLVANIDRNAGNMLVDGEWNIILIDHSRSIGTKNVTEVLGYPCDELVLTCKSGLQKYYFNTKLSVDITLFTNHKFGNWYDYLSKANSLPLKMIIDNSQFSWECVATKVTAMKLDKAFFELPANTTTMKSPQ